MKPDRATDSCRRGRHSDPDNSGMCIYCGLILDPGLGENPNEFRRRHGWSDVPLEPCSHNLDYRNCAECLQPDTGKPTTRDA